MKPIDELLGRLEGVRGSGGNYVAKCPSHDDRSPSLSVAEGDNGAVLIHCHAGCETYDILAAVGLGFGDLYPDPLPKRNDVDISRERLVLEMVRAARKRGESISPLDLNRAELAIHRIKAVTA